MSDDHIFDIETAEQAQAETDSVFEELKARIAELEAELDNAEKDHACTIDQRDAAENLILWIDENTGGKGECSLAYDLNDMAQGIVDRHDRDKALEEAAEIAKHNGSYSSMQQIRALKGTKP